MYAENFFTGTDPVEIFWCRFMATLTFKDSDWLL